ncbi:hypothetical protein [Streptomyces sp. NPDC057686]|uniref:hypothetical protein n=1 Tax=Streptomyces sp. NPDC057686 TaxID=3346212 RepID=UPI00369D58C4
MVVPMVVLLVVSAPERSVSSLPLSQPRPEGVHVTASVMDRGDPITLRVADLDRFSSVS